jgi:hypothetical protein
MYVTEGAIEVSREKTKQMQFLQIERLEVGDIHNMLEFISPIRVYEKEDKSVQTSTTYSPDKTPKSAKTSMTAGITK